MEEYFFKLAVNRLFSNYIPTAKIEKYQVSNLIKAAYSFAKQSKKELDKIYEKEIL